MSSSWPPNDHKDPGNVKNFELTLADTKVHKSGPIVSECLLLDKRKSKTKISQVLTRRLSQTEITIAAIIANLHNIGIIAQLQNIEFARDTNLKLSSEGVLSMSRARLGGTREAIR